MSGLHAAGCGCLIGADEVVHREHVGCRWRVKRDAITRGRLLGPLGAGYSGERVAFNVSLVHYTVLIDKTSTT